MGSKRLKGPKEDQRGFFEAEKLGLKRLNAL
jgi:hypothetical protein